MRKLAVWTAHAALLVGLGAVWCVAQEPSQDDSSSSANWLNRLLHVGKKQAPPPAAKKTPEPQPAVAVESPAARRLREKKTLDRRLEVCERLRDFAEKNNDESMQRIAAQLDERAFEIYKKNTGQNKVAAGRAPSDEQTLEKHLPLRTDLASQASARGAAAAGNDSRTAAGREQP